MRSWKTFISVPALVVLGCGTLQQPGASPAVSDDTPKYGGTLRVRAAGEPYDWDVTYSKGTGAAGRSMAMNSLLGFKTGPDVGHRERIIRPELAGRWEVSPDAKTYSFYLRRGVRFADLPPTNGRELTSTDAQWMLEYIARLSEFKKLPPANISWMVEGMEGVETPDPYTVTIRFKDPFAPFLNYVAHDYMGIAPREIYEQDGHLKDRIVGTGPYQFDPVATQKGTRWVFGKNRGYWEPGKPYIDAIHMLILPDAGSAYAAFRAKQVDWIDEVPPREAQEFTAQNPHAVGFEYIADPTFIFANNSLPPFNDIRMRKALSLAVDRDEFVRVITMGKGGWTAAGALPGTLSQEEVKSILRYDPAQASRLIREAGYEGTTIELPFSTDREQIRRTHAELLQSQLRKVGLQVVLKANLYSEEATSRRRHTHTLQISPKDVVADEDSWLMSNYYPGTGQNYDVVNQPKLTEMLVAQRREPDPAKRKEAIRQAVRYMNSECYCGIAIYYGSYTQFWHPQLKNYTPNGNVNGWPIENSWLEN